MPVKQNSYFCAGMHKLLLFLFCLFPLLSVAQFGNNATVSGGFDSTGVGRDSSRVQFAGFEISNSRLPDLKRYSYRLDRVQFYQPYYNDASLINSSLGNNGTACYPVFFNPVFSNGFASGFNAFNAYLLPIQETKFFDAQSPFTEAFYVQGSKEEAFFHLMHTQNAGRKVNFGLEYQRINSLGYIPNQTAQHSAIRLHTWLRPGKEKYQMLIALAYHKGSVLENGGITSEGDSLFQTGTENNFQLFPVNLTGSRNDIFNNGIKITHFLDLNRKLTDTLNQSKSNKAIIRAGLDHQYTFSKNTFNEANPANSYYIQIFDSSRTNTNYSEKRFENEFSLIFFKPAKDSADQTETVIKAFVRNQYIDFENNYADSIADNYKLETLNLLTGGLIKIPFSASLELNVNAQYFFAGFNRGDSYLKGNIRLGKINSPHFIAGVESWRSEALFNLQIFRGNYNLWNSNPDKTYQFKLFGRIELPKTNLKVDFSLSNTSRYRYLDENQNPQTKSNSLNTAQLKIIHEDLSVKKWHLQSRIILQFIAASSKSFVRVPAVQFQESLFREGYIRKTTPWRIGVDFIGCSKFTPMAYAPQLGAFYIQNNKSNDGILQMNAYVSVKIKRVRFFAMLEHSNSGLFGPPHLVIPYYPLPGRLLKLGLSWVFFD